MSEEHTLPLEADVADAVTFRYEIDADEPPSHALVSVTSSVSGTAPTDLEPTGRHVDLEALDVLVGPTDGGSGRSASVVLDADGLSLRIDDDEIVGVARRDVVGWSADGP